MSAIEQAQAVSLQTSDREPFSVIELFDLRLDYRSETRTTEVLRGLSFQIHAAPISTRGRKIAICGPSGSGKSTLLYILGGLLRPTSGRVRVLGQEIWSWDETRRARFRGSQIGFIYQNFHLLPSWSVLDNVMLAADYVDPREVPALRIRALNLIHRLGLKGLESRTPSQLSGGQAQRVAIARALLMNPEVILADEPTGALDPSTAKEIMAIFEELCAEGRTVVLITHDEGVASSCEQVIRLRDGVLDQVEQVKPTEERPAPATAQLTTSEESPLKRGNGMTRGLATLMHQFNWRRAIGSSWKLLRRNPSRNLLTLFGVAIGVAAVMSMITIGRFARERIVESYDTLGIRSFRVFGYTNWNLPISKPLETYFREFKDEELAALTRLFPDLEFYSPTAQFWGPQVSYGGRSVSDDVVMTGMNEHGLRLNELNIQSGRGISAIDVLERNAVCVIGSAIARELELTQIDYRDHSAEKPLLFIKTSRLNFACRVIGTLAEPRSASSRRGRAGQELVLPHSYLRAIRGESPNSNEGDFNNVIFEVRAGADPEKLSKHVEKFFQQKYGVAGDFRANTNNRVLDQMAKFLRIFNGLLIGVAFVTLLVGATGVTNMILVSLGERLRELGLRRAVGAEPRDLRSMVIGESMTLCGLAGVVGLVSSMVLLHLVLYGVSLAFPDVKFVWTFDLLAIAMSLISIVSVGIGSGLYPALRAEQLDVVAALRAE